MSRSSLKLHGKAGVGDGIKCGDDESVVVMTARQKTCSMSGEPIWSVNCVVTQTCSRPNDVLPKRSAPPFANNWAGGGWIETQRDHAMRAEQQATGISMSSCGVQAVALLSLSLGLDVVTTRL